MYCATCQDSGEIRGLGFMMVDCPKCSSTEKSKSSVKTPVLDKRSKSYRDAITDLHKLHPGKSRDEICKIFDDEFNKIEA